MKKNMHSDLKLTSTTDLRLLAYSVKDFCRAVGISTRMFYALTAAGDGPVLTRIGRRILITYEAADQWLRAHEGKKAA